MDPETRFYEVLKQAGGFEVSRNKHIKYRLANGATLIRSMTPSDRNAWNAAVRDLCKKAEIPWSNEIRNGSGRGRFKRDRGRPAWQGSRVCSGRTLREQLLELQKRAA